MQAPEPGRRQPIERPVMPRTTNEAMFQAVSKTLVAHFTLDTKMSDPSKLFYFTKNPRVRIVSWLFGPKQRGQFMLALVYESRPGVWFQLGDCDRATIDAVKAEFGGIEQIEARTDIPKLAGDMFAHDFAESLACNAKPDRQKQLREAFEMVENKLNWKNPIKRTLPIDTSDEQLALIDEAVRHFAGCTATITRRPDGRAVVTAPGYYVAVGA